MKSRHQNPKQKNCPVRPCTGIQNYFNVNSFSTIYQTTK